MTQDITEETLNSLVKETFRFEPAQDQSLAVHPTEASAAGCAGGST